MSKVENMSKKALQEIIAKYPHSRRATLARNELYARKLDKLKKA